MNVRIQYRFLIVLLTAIVVLAGVVVAVRQFQVSRHASAFLTEARNAVEADEPAEAVRLYTQYLGLHRDSADAHAELAEILIQQGNLSQAFFHLKSALRLEPDRLATRRSLAKVAMDLGRTSDARNHLAYYLIPAEPENAEYHWLLGTCETSLGNFEAALEQLQLANQAAGDNPLYAESLADLLSTHMSQTAEARTVLDAALEKSPENPVAFLVRGRWLLGQSSQSSPGENVARESLLEAAWQDVQSAVRLSEGSLESVLLLVDVAIASKRPSEARDAIKAAINANPKIARLYSSAAKLELVSGDEEAAADFLKEGLKVAPGNQELLFKRAEMELNSNNLESAERLIAELRAANLAIPVLRYLEARLLIGKGQWKPAVDLLESSRVLFDRNEELLRDVDYLLALCHRGLGNPDQEIEALQRSVSNAPLSAVSREALAMALMRSGRIQEAIAGFSQLAEQPNASPTAMFSLARLMFIDGLGRDFQGQDWDPLRRVLTTLETQTEGSGDLAILQAELLLVDKKPDDAESRLRSALEAKPDEAQLHQALVSLLIREQAWDEVEAALDAAEQVLSDSALMRLERGRYLIRRFGDEVELEQLDQLATPLESWEEPERVRLATGFASYFLSLEDYSRAERQARVVADSEIGNSNLAIHLLLLDLAFRSGKGEKLAEALEKVKQIEGGGPLWRVGEAVRLSIEASALDEADVAERNRLFTRANEHLSEAAVDRPGWPRIPSLKGEIFERQGLREQALQSYVEAISLGEQSTQTVSRAILILFEQGRFVEADKIVRKLQEQNTPFSSDLTRVASQISLQLDNFDRALSLARDWVRKSDRQEDHVYLAQLLSISRKFEEAEAEFRVAIEKDPSEPGPWVALVQMFGRLGNRDAALGVIEEARAAIRPEELDDALAQCYQSIEDDDQAELSYRTAVEKDPKNTGLIRRFAEFYLTSGRAALSQPLLEQIASDESDADPIEQAWARRNLALVLAAQGNDDAFRQARQLITTNVERMGENLDDQRSLALVLGLQKSSETIPEAIKILEDVVKKQGKYSLPDNHLLAELYFRSDDWDRYRRAMRGVMSNGGADDSRYVQDFAENLLRHGDLEEAQRWLSRLKELAPKEIDTARVEANLLFKAANYSKLFEMLESNSKQPERREWATAAAELFGSALLRDGKTEEASRLLALAKNLFTEIASSDLKKSLTLVSFHARQGDFDPMFELLRNSDFSADELPRIGFDAMRSNRLGVEPGKKLIEIFKANRERAADKIAIDMSIGDLAGWIHDGGAAADAYRQILKAQPDNVVALNNLAMILALTGGEISESLSTIDHAIEIAGPAGFLLDTRAIVRLTAGDLARAKEDLGLAIKEAPKADRYFHLAQVLLAEGRGEEAKAAFSNAIAGGLTEDALHPLERSTMQRLAEQFNLTKPDPAAVPAL